MPSAPKQQKTSNFIEFYEISTEGIPLERAKLLGRRTFLGFVARHDFESGNNRVDEGFRICVRTYSLKGTGFSRYINDAM
jgi:hypothetical protein